MLEIDHLVLHLPAGFEKRATRLGRLTAEALASRPPTGRTGTLPQLAIPTQKIFSGWSDRRIADHLADAIQRQLNATGTTP